MHDNFLDGGQEFSFNYNPIKPETAFPGVMPSAENDITLLQNPKHQCRELHAASLSFKDTSYIIRYVSDHKIISTVR